jgi:hypothetical protein
MRASNRPALSGVAALLVLAAIGMWAAEMGDLNEFLGTWRGKSTCVNREAAPACIDEVVVYEVRRSDTPNAAVLRADKIVDGQRVPMGELAFAYSHKDGCWRSELSTPRVHGVWCLMVNSRVMTGSLRLLPENADVREVRLEHE